MSTSILATNWLAPVCFRLEKDFTCVWLLVIILSRFVPLFRLFLYWCWCMFRLRVLYTTFRIVFSMNSTLPNYYISISLLVVKMKYSPYYNANIASCLTPW
ncbi:hypothetical protein M441DRAFT_413616 [Trichoderma asperellum CBS 433.97]|uniref:Uncharacterized protein n=1 Tax=Trichoderma asperellum (strain ATCC 204424 / CBS 433.97 / NBRC 101777) TaxID=1042311 RepID=A0A2T3Z7R2_TRIA4|nr:hypothetical protein M441DRAFT_413616 [Trichoderma asperellum CBS 433.97]PTB40863.1 hypothetical protein M441DRAFT_413616 [Trichoderma asperellum CBS 433.97]